MFVYRLHTTTCRVWIEDDAFLQDIASDDLVTAADKTQLCVWRYASAEQLAYAVRTILRDPEQAGLARSGCASWNRGLFEQHRTTTREVYAREQRFTQAPFWRASRAQEAELAGRLLPQRFAPHPDAGPAVLGRRLPRPEKKFATPSPAS